MNKLTLYIGGGVVIALAVMLAGWYIFFGSVPGESSTTGTETSFGVSDNRTSVSTNGEQTTNSEAPVSKTGDTPKKIFRIVQGPVAGATLLESGRPTTTVARYVEAESGHIVDLVIDSPGATPRVVSNTTIPGIQKVLWSGAGRGALVQYVDQGVIKTAHFSLPQPGSTTPARVQFLQNNIASLAVSPDGTNVAYLIKTTAGADIYTARADGAGAKKIGSLPLSQLQLQWPAAATLLAVSAQAAGVSGGVFSIDAKTGAAAPILFADGLSATADRTFAHLVYQTAGATRASYLLNTKSGLSQPLSFDPLPEQCLFGAATGTMYCAAPLQYVEGNYIDQRHQGTASAQEGLFAFNLSTAHATLLAKPGEEGGEVADIEQFALSPSEKYALYMRRGDRSLWGVRLAQ